ncbi:MAG TPA: hypothetical protein VEC14_00105, partial [Reyranellaceae bacterium]|nr:hypothetical protein [Reyranellaceae bacterium]
QPDVVAKLGAELALTIRPSGRPIGAQATLREVWRLPSPGARDPADGAVKLEFASRFDVRLGDTLRRQFVFDQPWKIVRGEWLVEYWDGTRKLLNRKFILK